MNLVGSVSLSISSVAISILTCLSSPGMRRPRSELLQGDGGVEGERAQES
jgi:hypothetical protein